MATPSSYATAQKLFLATLVKNLFAKYPFLMYALNWNKYAVGNEVIYPQSGAKPKSRINGKRGAASKRPDIRRNYFLDEVLTDPTIVEWTEELLINYAKRLDVLRDHMKVLELDIVMRIMYNWTKGASEIIRTTGDVRPAYQGTGNRHSANVNELFQVRKIFKKQGVPDDGRSIALVPVDLETDFTSQSIFRSKDTYPNMVLMNGALGRVAGFNVIPVPQTIVFNNAATPVAQIQKADDSSDERSVGNADNLSILCFHPDYVTRSISRKSKVSIIDTHEGVEVSTTTVAGGEVLRKDGEGVVVVVEKAAPAS